MADFNSICAMAKRLRDYVTHIVTGSLTVNGNTEINDGNLQINTTNNSKILIHNIPFVNVISTTTNVDLTFNDVTNTTNMFVVVVNSGESSINVTYQPDTSYPIAVGSNGLFMKTSTIGSAPVYNIMSYKNSS